MVKREQTTNAVGSGLGNSSRAFRVWVVLAASALGVLILALLPGGANAAAAVPSGFKESIILSRTAGGLSNPTNLESSKDGRLFVAE